MFGVTAERLASLQAQLNNDAIGPGEPVANKENLDESPRAPSVRSSSSWVYGKSGLSSPNSSVDGGDLRDPLVSPAYRSNQGMPTPAQLFEREKLAKRHKERTLLRAKVTASAGSLNGVPVTSAMPAESDTINPTNPGVDGAKASIWPLAREQQIEAYHRACREEPGYARLASPYYSVKQNSPALKRPTDDSSSPEPKRQKRISEDKSEDDEIHLTGIDADMSDLVSAETDLVGNPPPTSSQYAIARKVRKQSKPSVQKSKELGVSKVSQSQGLTKLQQPDNKPFLHNPHDLWRPDSKPYYEPRTEEEKFNAWLKADRERCELQKLQLKEVQEQMRRDYGHVSWGDWGSSDHERRGWPSQVKDLDNVSEKSPSANSISSINSNSRSSTTTVSSDGDSPHLKKGEDSIGEATVQTASQVDNAPHDLPESTKELLHTTHNEKPQDVQAAQETQDVSRELTPTSLICETMVKSASQVDKAQHDSPVPAVELPKSTHTEKPEEALAAKDTQDVAHVLAPAQAFRTKTTQSHPLDRPETKDVSNGDTQEPAVSHDTRKGSGPGTLVVYTEGVDGLQQDTPKVLQWSESSKVSQAPPTDVQSRLLPEVGE